jgi:hypothetical protein
MLQSVPVIPAAIAGDIQRLVDANEVIEQRIERPGT